MKKECIPINQENFHIIKILEELTISRTIKWKENNLGILVSKMGPFDLYIDRRSPYSEEKPLLDIHASDRRVTYNHSLVLTEITLLVRLVIDNLNLD